MQNAILASLVTPPDAARCPHLRRIELLLGDYTTRLVRGGRSEACRIPSSIGWDFGQVRRVFSIHDRGEGHASSICIANDLDPAGTRVSGTSTSG